MKQVLVAYFLMNWLRKEIQKEGIKIYLVIFDKSFHIVL